MSSAPPPSRLRQKTSDFTDFIRGTSHHTAASASASRSTASVNMLEVPLSGDESTSPTKKKITRIPLFGRSRKKSNQSATTSPFAGRESTSERGEQSGASRGPSVERRPSEPALDSPAPPLPVPNKASSSSLGSKFAARFSHSRSKAVASTHEQPPPVPAVQQSSLFPPGAGRGASFESDSSILTKSRSTTPRPSQPAITVSLSPDDDERFKDLFTKEAPASSPPVPPKTSRTTRSLNASDPDASTLSVAPAVPSKEPSIYRRGYTPASAIAASVRHRHTASTTSKNSRKNSDSSEKDTEQESGSSTPRLSDAQHGSPRPSENSSMLEEKGIPSSLTRRLSAVSPESASSTLNPGRAPSLRSRMKQAAANSQPSQPPTMPLPLPPSQSLPSSSPPNSPTFPRLARHMHKDSISSTSISSLLPGVPRTRAQTISGGTNGRSSRVSPTPTSPTSPTSPASTIKPASPVTGSPRNSNEAFDIDNASADQLRQRLRARDKQYDELAHYVEKLQKAHKREVDELLGRISTLEKDAVKLEKQIQGFMWMVRENNASQPKAPPSASASSQTRSAAGAVHESEPETGRGALSNRARSRIVYYSDSGADSQAESLIVSGASGSESVTSSILRKKIRRPYPVGDGSYIARSGSILRPTNIPATLIEQGLPDIPSGAANSNTKRTSVSSISVSPSSSTSSLLPPSPSITMSSLSAIPEGPPSPLRPLHLQGDHLDSDRRARLMANRVSTSSLASSITAASSSYSANIKRSRPPSIAQVLDTSPKDNNILDKLRPFS